MDERERYKEELYQKFKKTDAQSYEYKEAVMMYECAILEVTTKLDVLNHEFQIRASRNPIKTIKSRIKSVRSTFDKLYRKGCEISVESMKENIHDMAGIRVICAFIDDIYSVVSMLTSQDDITVIEVEDYIKNPKSNGYRSLHLIVEVPIFLSDSKRNMRVEVQIRTIAMDFWASLEHEIHYKKNNASKDVIRQLTECADTIYETDLHMQDIRKMIYSDTDKDDRIYNE